MFESIQDYLCGEIDKNKLFENMTSSKEYQNSSKEVQEAIDLYIEELKDMKNEKEFVNKISDPIVFENLGIFLEDIDIYNLATRTCKGIVPIVEPAVLLGFIDASIDVKDDERLFRLAYNYDSLLSDKSIIEDYFIKNKNAFYINELACNEISNLDLNKLANALIDIGNLEELKYFADHVIDKNFDKSKVLDKIKELEQ